MFSSSSLMWIGGIIAALVAAGVGFRAYSRKVQRDVQAGFYHILSGLICRYFNEKYGNQYVQQEIEKLLIAGKHGNALPGLRLAKLRVVYVQNGRYDIQVLLYVDNELVTITVKDMEWVSLPLDIQSSAVRSAGDSCEFLLLD